MLRHLAQVYKKFLEVYDLHDAQVYLNSVLMAKAIDNALIDMQRMSTWHIDAEASPDAHKYSGFMAKWIAKERPIQFRKELPVSQINDRLYWANATFAVFVMSSFLGGNGIPVNLGCHMRYWFAFRDEKGEVLSLVAYCCEQISSTYSATC